MSNTRQHVHELIDRLPEPQIAGLERFLESIINPMPFSLRDAPLDDEDLDEEDVLSLRASEEYFRNGGTGIPFEEVVADLGFTMEQIREAKSK